MTRPIRRRYPWPPRGQHVVMVGTQWAIAGTYRHQQLRYRQVCQRMADTAQDIGNVMARFCSQIEAIGHTIKIWRDSIPPDVIALLATEAQRAEEQRDSL